MPLFSILVIVANGMRTCQHVVIIMRNSVMADSMGISIKSIWSISQTFVIVLVNKPFILAKPRIAIIRRNTGRGTVF